MRAYSKYNKIEVNQEMTEILRATPLGVEGSNDPDELMFLVEEAQDRARWEDISVYFAATFARETSGQVTAYDMVTEALVEWITYQLSDWLADDNDETQIIVE